MLLKIKYIFNAIFVAVNTEDYVLTLTLSCNGQDGLELHNSHRSFMKHCFSGTI